MKAVRVGFIFKSGRQERMFHEGPTEFFYGLPELKRAGWNVDVLTDSDLGISQAPTSAFWRLASRTSYALTGLSAWVLRELSKPEHLRLLNEYDVLVATTNSFGLAIGCLQRLGLVKARVVSLAMGLVNETTRAAWLFSYRMALKRVDLYALAEADALISGKMLKREIGVLRFGVDSSFWHPRKRGPESEDFVLSLGNDRHRDFDFLVRAWKPEYPLLKIVTKLPVTSPAVNIKIVHGDWHAQALTDNEIRTLYQDARFVVLPIRDTYQPSGQSACLQAMACGKAVAITDFSGLWNRESMVSGETCVLAGVPGATKDMQSAIERLLRSQDWSDALGNRARSMVEKSFTVGAMAADMGAVLSCR